jgi:cellulase/cellobiase CelA1
MMFKGWNDALNATCIAPAPSAGPTPPPAPQPAPRKDALKITVTQDSTWSGGYCRGFVVQNTGATGVGAGWRLQFTLPAGAQITKSWNGASSRSGNTVTVTPPDWAALLPAGVSANPFGFCASSSGGEPSDVQIILPTSSSSRRLVGATNRNAAANALTVDTHYDSTWDEGFCVTFEVKNQGAQTVQNYKLHFQLPNGASITKSWNGQVVSSTGGAIVVQPPTFAAALAPGAESNPFGFCAAGVGRLSQISAS